MAKLSQICVIFCDNLGRAAFKTALFGVVETVVQLNKRDMGDGEAHILSWAVGP
jgi:hypothetical protein